MNSHEIERRGDEIKRQAECLETGRRGDNRIVIKLGQLSSFFSRIATNKTPTPQGKEILAFRGVDPIKADEVLEKIKNVKKTQKIDKQETGSATINFTTPVIEADQFNQIATVGDNLRQKAQKSIEKINYQNIERGQIGRVQHLDVDAALKLSANSEKAEKLAIDIKKALLSEQKLDLAKVLQKTYDPETNSVFSSYFRLLKEDSDQIGFLKNQYRIANFGKLEKDISLHDVEEISQKKLPKIDNSIDPYWKVIWVAFRAGLDRILREIKRDNDKKQFHPIIDLILQENQQDNSNENGSMGSFDVMTQDNRNPISATIEDICSAQQPLEDASLLETTEDFLFDQLYPIKRSSTPIITKNVQQIIWDETAQIVRHNKDFEFTRPLFLILTDQYDEAAKCLLECNQHLVETAHICLLLYPKLRTLKYLVGEFIEKYVTILGEEYSDVAAFYLAYLTLQKDSDPTPVNRVHRYLVNHPMLTIPHEFVKNFKNCIPDYNTFVDDSKDKEALANAIIVLSVLERYDRFDYIDHDKNKINAQNGEDGKNNDGSEQDKINLKDCLKIIPEDKLLILTETLSRDVVKNHYEMCPYLAGLAQKTATLCLSRANTLPDTEKYRLFDVSTKIFEEDDVEKPLVYSYFDLYLGFLENDQERIEKVIEQEEIFPRTKDDIKPTLENIKASKVDPYGTMIGETTAKTIIYLIKSNEDPDLLNVLFYYINFLRVSNETHQHIMALKLERK